MNSPGTISISGNIAKPEFPTLVSGWNFVGSSFQKSFDFSQLYNENYIKTVKNFDGYWAPNDPLSSIKIFEPGNGYYILK